MYNEMFLSFLDEEKYLSLRCGAGVWVVLHVEHMVL